MVYKYISVKRIIAKVFTDLDLQEGTHRLSDMIEWAGEAVKKIGGFPTLETRVTGKDNLPLLIIEGFQAKLPCDLVSINQVAYSTNIHGPFFALNRATGSFDSAVPSTKYPSEPFTGDLTTPNELVDLTMSLYGESYQEALTRLNSYPNIREQLTALLYRSTYRATNKDTVTLSNAYTYVVQPGSGYIKTNFRDGYLMVSYQAAPIDEEGFPLIPDNESFEEAIYWYINMKLTYPEWKAGRIRDAVYYDARNSWNFYRRQAYATSMMPDSDQLESLKNTWVRLVPQINEHETFFSYLGEAQVIHNQDKR